MLGFVFQALVRARSQAPVRPAGYKNRKLRPEEAVSVVVVAAIANLASPHEALRAQAYALVQSLARSLDIASLDDVVAVPGLHVPVAPLGLMGSVSERLAVALGGTVPIGTVGASLGVLVHFAVTIDHSSSAEAAACVYA